MEVIFVFVGDIFNYVLVVIFVLVVLVIGLFISDFLKNIVKIICDFLVIFVVGFILNIVFYFLFLNVVMIVLVQVKIDIGFIQDNLFIILVGIVFVFVIGYGFVFWNIVANFLAFFYNKGKVSFGDYVEIDGVVGKVIVMDSSIIMFDVKDCWVIIFLSKLMDKSIVILKFDVFVQEFVGDRLMNYQC